MELNYTPQFPAKLPPNHYPGPTKWHHYEIESKDFGKDNKVGEIDIKSLPPIIVNGPCMCLPRGRSSSYTSLEGMMKSIAIDAATYKAGGCGGRNCPWSKP